MTDWQLDWVGVRAGHSVLDLGCAEGDTCRMLAEVVGARGSVVGVDSAAARIAEARRHPDHRPWIEYRLGQAETIPAADGEFDLAWSRFLFEYLSDPTVVLREMIRVTRPGGTIAVSDLDGNWIWHEPIAPSLEREIEEALSVLAGRGFDPNVGRKLYHLAWEADLAEIEMDVRPYHVIAGRVDVRSETLWEEKLWIMAQTLYHLGWTWERGQSFRQRFIEHLRDPGAFTYSVLITVKGRRSAAMRPADETR